MNQRRRQFGLLLVVVLVCVGIGAPTAIAATPSVPMAQQITIPGWLNPGQPVVSTDGDLWVAAQRFSGQRLDSALLKITTTGSVLRVLNVAATPLLIGPDGSLWFETTGADEQLGVVTSNGRVRTFAGSPALLASPLAPGVDGGGMTVGPDGRVWFVAQGSHAGTSEIGYISSLGRVTDLAVPTEQATSITTDKNGYVWLGGGTRTVWISPTGQHGTLTSRDDFQGPLAPDLTGDVWASDGYGDRLDEVRSKTSTGPRAIRSVEWTSTASAGYYSSPQYLAASGAGQVWFVGDSVCSYSLTPLGPSCTPADPQLGFVSLAGITTVYPSPVSFIDQLTAGPDGRLYTSDPTSSTAVAGGYIPNNDGTLWAIALPNAPEVRAPSIRLLSAIAHTHSTAIVIHCAGQPGRLCSGTVTLKAGQSAKQSQTYAFAPDHTTTFTIATAAHPVGTLVRVQVTNSLRNGRTGQELAATIHSRR